MMEKNLKREVEEMLLRVLNQKIASIQMNTVGGGSINETYQITINKNQKLFCKINSSQEFPALFTKEKNGLRTLAEQNIINTPTIVACEELADKQILILEWIEQGSRTEDFWKTFGEQMAALHKVSWTAPGGQPQFGLAENNYMGALQQSNKPSNSWIDFFIHQRIESQLKRALDKHLIDNDSVKHFNNLYNKLPEIFSDEPSSLLHGDLWSGNFLCHENTKPVLIDPAVYYGHRSIDLAMTTLFGGFDKIFYEVYDYLFPFPLNYREQWQVCNLYPLLIHLNLFGKSYLSDILKIIKRF